MLRRFFPHSCALVVTVCSLALTGCGPETRSEATATIDGVVTYEGNAVPEGSRLVLEDRSKGIRMSFDVGAEGKFTVNDASELPAGTYNVAVLPPAEEGVSEDEYDAAMENPDAEADEEQTDDFPVPEEMRDPNTSEKTVEVTSGSQSLNIEL